MCEIFSIFVITGMFYNLIMWVFSGLKYVDGNIVSHH